MRSLVSWADEDLCPVPVVPSPVLIREAEEPKYSFDDVYAASLLWFAGDELAANVFATKYALQDSEGNYLERTPSDMIDRLTAEFARIEQKYPNPLSKEEIRSLLAYTDPVTGKESIGGVIPQGSPMSGIGNPYKIQSISNCFVITSPYDSYSGIMRTDEEQVSIMKRRGGVGFDISTLRPRGERTANAAGTTDGIALFMERFSNSTREVAQGGRRGALMLSVSVNHPDIFAFIEIKRDKTKVTGANVSVRVTDEFMKAVVADADFTLRWPCHLSVEEAKVKRTVRARDVWDKIVTAAHDNAEPGILFWDNIEANGPADIYSEFKSTSTNPCSEIPLSPGDSCRLMLMNLTRFVKDPYTSNAVFDFKLFDEAVQKAQRLMDDVVDLEIECVDKILAKVKSDPEPLEIKRNELDLWTRIKNMGVLGRRTGLGVTALADAMAAVGVKYGSLESVAWVENVYRTMAIASYRSSVTMAEERGAFPAFDAATEEGHTFLTRVLADDADLWEKYQKFGRRNIANTTTPPAGSMSILAQTSSGCEPVFKLSYTRRKKHNPNEPNAQIDYVDATGEKWSHFNVFHQGVERWKAANPGRQISESPYEGATSADIDWRTRIAIQAAAQRWICHSISSTVNLPRETTVETVNDLYIEAWKSGCKGVTIYRDGCRDGVLVSEEPDVTVDRINDSSAPSRPKDLVCDIHHTTIKGEKYVVLVGLMEGRPYEIFAGLSQHVEIPKKIKRGTIIKNGKNADGASTYNLKIPVGDDDYFVIKDIVEQFANKNYGAFSRTISMSLRHGVPLPFIVEQLRKDKHSDVTSFASVVARTLAKHYITDGRLEGQKCPECGSTNMLHQSGCVSCGDCTYSKCS